jgi:hypothetical protein
MSSGRIAGRPRPGGGTIARGGLVPNPDAECNLGG